MTIELKTGAWNLTDLKDVPKNGLNVFSCFHCGGGSTMGYKLAGFNVIGGVEIDPEMMRIYRDNHNPRFSYLMGVQEFKKITDEKLPKELFDLDILDGSPPCSSFSMAGSREKAWGEKKKFREGQAEQVLDDLFFDYIDIAKKLQPKVVVAENVKGLIQGNARGYVKEIFKQFKLAGYETQLFLLNASRMGVPQTRERTFFIANRLNRKIKFDFNEDVITIGMATEDLKNQKSDFLSGKYFKYWHESKKGGRTKDIGLNTAFNFIRLNNLKPVPTLTSQGWHTCHWDEPRNLSIKELCRAQSFPDDYFINNNTPRLQSYICGMSVPPFMMQRIANQIAIQFFGKNL